MTLDWVSLTETNSYAKMELMGIAKSINPGHPAKSAKADHGRNFSLLADFLRIKGGPSDLGTKILQKY